MLTVRVAWIFSLFPLSCFAAPLLDVIETDPNYTSITLENETTTLSQKTTVLSLHDAFKSTYTSKNDTVTLFPKACLQLDGTQNCTAACQNRTQMFSSLKTLHNCAVFPEISINLANNNLTTNARVLAEELGIKSSYDDSSVLSNISNAIRSCLNDSCTLDPQCNRTLNGRNSHHSLNNFTGTQFINICGPKTAYVNADVGGIGVWSHLVLSSMSVS